MKNNTKKIFAFIGVLLFLCCSANADVPCDQTKEVCCENKTKEQCCASIGGYWCEQEDKCYEAKGTTITFATSACMTKSLCTQMGGLYCTDPRKCYYYSPEQYYEGYYGAYGGCKQHVDGEDCISSDFYWCSSNQKCYVSKSLYAYECSEVQNKTACEALDYFWCTDPLRCYSSIGSYTLNCNEVKNETGCTSKGYFWCQERNRCYETHERYNQLCNVTYS